MSVFLLIGIFTPKDDTSMPNGMVNSNPSQSSQVDNSEDTQAKTTETPTGSKYHFDPQCGGVVKILRQQHLTAQKHGVVALQQMC